MSNFGHATHGLKTLHNIFVFQYFWSKICTLAVITKAFQMEMLFGLKL